MKHPRKKSSLKIFLNNICTLETYFTNLRYFFKRKARNLIRVYEIQGDDLNQKSSLTFWNNILKLKATTNRFNIWIRKGVTPSNLFYHFRNATFFPESATNIFFSICFLQSKSSRMKFQGYMCIHNKHWIECDAMCSDWHVVNSLQFYELGGFNGLIIFSNSMCTFT